MQKREISRNSKKAVSEIIATILIVLFVIAALVIVSVVLFQFIRGKSGEIDTKTQCGYIILSIIRAKYEPAGANLSITVKKDKGEADLYDMRFFIDGKEKAPAAGSGNTNLSTIAEGTYVFSGISAKPLKIEVTPVIFIAESEKQVVCENAASAQGNDIV